MDYNLYVKINHFLPQLLVVGVLCHSNRDKLGQGRPGLMREMQIVGRGNLYIPAVLEGGTAVLEGGTAASNKVLQGREHRLSLLLHDRQN